MTEREAAWTAIHDAHPPGRRVGSATDHGHGRWEVVARGRKLGGRQGPPPDTIVGEGFTEIEVLADLAERLRRASDCPRDMRV